MARPHGIRGEVVVRLTTDRVERLEPGAELSTDRGSLTVVAARRDRDRWLVRFDGVEGRDAAEGLRGLVLRAAPIEDPEVLWVHELIGMQVISQDGVDRGRVTAVQANPAADLLVLDDGSLVPLTFVVGTPRHGVVRVDVPDGLFDL